MRGGNEPYMKYGGAKKKKNVKAKFIIARFCACWTYFSTVYLLVCSALRQKLVQPFRPKEILRTATKEEKKMDLTKRN